MTDRAHHASVLRHMRTTVGLFIIRRKRMEPLKQPLSYENQIIRLREHHGLTIGDEDRARVILSRVNYYRLSAYGIGLKCPDNHEKYLPGISLERIYRLYRFDCALRSLLIPVIEEIEIELRTRIAYQLAMRYGAEGYRDEQHFRVVHMRDGETVHYSTMRKLEDEIRRQHNLPCVKHHQEKYGGHFPIWAAVELFSFGMLSSLYSIMKWEDQKAVAKTFGVDAPHLNGWIQALTEIRNICAHYGRIYNMPLKQAPSLYREHEDYRGNRLFPRILVMGRLLKGHSIWNTFCTSLAGLLEEYSEVNLGLIGFPNDWQKILEEQQKK